MSMLNSIQYLGQGQIDIYCLQMMTYSMMQCFIENKLRKVGIVQFTADDYHVAMPLAPSHPYQFLSKVSIFNVFCDNGHVMFKLR